MDDPSVVRPVPDEIARRFVLRRRLGEGGFGVVHQALDRALGTEVALKELLSMDPAALYAFKQEFRALADVVHTNLVGLQELFSVGGRWYLTMDLVRGVHFLRHVRPSSAALRANEATIDASSADTERAAVPADLGGAGALYCSGVISLPASRVSPMAMTAPFVPPSASRAPFRHPDVLQSEVDMDRLRGALLQLADGVEAIHRTGRAHRDLKPSNVLVTSSGRVVILDFGLVGSFSVAARGGVVMGTPSYMAPEQAAGASVDPAADWYALGVMLYEALTGTIPHLFEGTTLEELLLTKPLVDPPPPRAITKDVPSELDDLCMRLLARDARARAGADDIRRAVGAPVDAAPSPSLRGGLNETRATFVGRAPELSALREAYAAARSNGALVLHVHGTSGMGKSDLVRNFLEGLPEADEPIVLEGRCHEREWMPYKAFDGAIDALARWLDARGSDEAAQIVPRGLSALVRLFPVLGRLEALGAISEHEAPDPHELRRRGFAALRELLSRIGQRRALVLYVDDLQWADADSATLLDALLAPPSPPRLLLVASYRTEEGQASVFVQSLPSPARPAAGIATREVVVGPLSPEDAEALARSILGDGGDKERAAQKAARIAREAGGSPFFVQELARHASSEHATEGIKLSEVVGARVSALPSHVRAMLEIVSAAGRPIESVVLREAAGLEEEDERAALSLLRSGCLVRAKGRGGDARVETYHDRIRETVVQGLSEETLRERHRSLAMAMESMSNANPEALAMHFRMAGEPGRARAYIERAAQRAERALAFDRAATLYRTVLDLADAADRGAIELRLAGAIAKAGRGAEAAKVFLSAAERLGSEEAFIAKRRAAEHLLRSGHMDEGLDVVRELLPHVGMRLAPTPRHALVSMLASRFKLRLRGLHFSERPESQIDPQALHRIDLCWSIGNGLGGTDIIRGADFQARHLLISLDAGEPYRIARAFSWEAVLRSLEGTPASLAQAEDLAARADAIARRIQHPHAIAWASAGKALAAHNGQRFREAITLCEQTIALFREACTDISWEVASMYAWWLLPALYYIGDLEGMRGLLPRCMSEADTLGDRYMATALGSHMVPMSLTLAGQPRDAIESADEAIRRWASKGYHSMHMNALAARANASIYLGEGGRAHEEVQAIWKRLEASYLLRSKAGRIRLTDMRARATLAAAKDHRSPEPLLRDASKIAGQLEKERTSWSDGHALSLRAAVCVRRNDIEGARSLYDRARASFSRVDMDLFASCAERHLGELERDAARVAQIDARILAHGVKDPERAAATLIAI